MGMLSDPMEEQNPQYHPGSLVRMKRKGDMYLRILQVEVCQKGGGRRGITLPANIKKT